MKKNRPSLKSFKKEVLKNEKVKAEYERLKQEMKSFTDYLANRLTEEEIKEIREEAVKDLGAYDICYDEVDQVHIIRVKEIPGACTDGKTIEEAMENIKEVIAAIQDHEK